MPWLVEGVFAQDEKETLVDLPSAGSRPPPARIVHLVNPFRAAGGDCDDRTQALTYEAMRRARDFSGAVPIHLAAAVAESERDCVPEGFELAGTLERTIDRMATFAHPRPLPLLFDILDAGCRHARDLAAKHGDTPDRVYLIFTNADICPMPQFYDAVAGWVAQGFDAMTINRRTIAPHPREATNLHKMYGELGRGHPGFDCFVFALSHFERFVRCDAFVGGDLVARSLLYNMVAASHAMLMLRRAHLTFHVGDEREWSDPKFKDHRDFNARQAIKVVTTLIERDPEIGSKVVRFCHANDEPIKFTRGPA